MASSARLLLLLSDPLRVLEGRFWTPLDAGSFLDSSLEPPDLDSEIKVDFL